MYDAGCRWLYFGIESGSQTRQKDIKKKLNLQKAKQTIQNCAEIGIVTSTSFIISFPDETEEELIETLRYIESLNADILLPSFFGPIPKSEYYELLVKSGRLSDLKTYQECVEFKMMDSCGKNYSKVSTKELKVIFSHYAWTSFLRKYPNKEKKSRLVARRAIIQTLNTLREGTLKSMWLVIIAAREFLEIVYYANMFPRVRKKYGLKLKTVKKQN